MVPSSRAHGQIESQCSQTPHPDPPIIRIRRKTGKNGRIWWLGPGWPCEQALTAGLPHGASLHQSTGGDPQKGNPRLAKWLGRSRQGVAGFGLGDQDFRLIGSVTWVFSDTCQTLLARSEFRRRSNITYADSLCLSRAAERRETIDGKMKRRGTRNFVSSSPAATDLPPACCRAVWHSGIGEATTGTRWSRCSDTAMPSR